MATTYMYCITRLVGGSRAHPAERPEHGAGRGTEHCASSLGPYARFFFILALNILMILMIISAKGPLCEVW